MKKLLKEFKTFITRGNVVDLSVGVIVGSAFTAIVTALSDHIIKPIINWVLSLVMGSNSLDGIYTYLKKVETDGTVDLANSIYIDWGAFINAIINFLIIAVVVFTIVKLINKAKDLADVNERMTKEVQKKFDNNEELNDFEQKWLTRYEKRHSDLAPKKKVEEAPVEETPAEPTATEKLLAEILEELKSQKVENS